MKGIASGVEMRTPWCFLAGDVVALEDVVDPSARAGDEHDADAGTVQQDEVAHKRGDRWPEQNPVVELQDEGLALERLRVAEDFADELYVIACVEHLLVLNINRHRVQLHHLRRAHERIVVAAVAPALGVEELEALQRHI